MPNERIIYNQRMDYKGRVYVPKELRGAADMNCGDIVRLSVSKGILCVRRIHIIEIGDKSPEAVEAYVRAAVRGMPREKQISVAAELIHQIEQAGENEAKRE
jgi:bifunctional DNA-binding transcriptional regulator/antitoxin component of YhaV-PrlF toxin-antitoxin module